MTRAGFAFALALGAALWPSGASGEASKKPTPEPFYRKYMIPGDPLDEKILAQEKRVEASPNDPNLRNDFGNLLAERRFPAQAAEQYEMAIQLDKKNFISAYNLGLLRETEGKISSAISAYQRSIKRKPGFPQSRFRLGRLYEQTNNPQSAVKEYAAAMWIDPAMRDPRRNPLLIDSQLIYLASLANYERDVAVASMTEASVYFENDRFRKLPTNRAIASREVEADDESEAAAPRDVGSPGSVGVTGAAEPVRRGPKAPLPPPTAGQRPAGASRPRAQGAPRVPPGAPAAPAPAAPAAAAPAAETAEPTPADAQPESAPEPAVTPGPAPDAEPS